MHFSGFIHYNPRSRRIFAFNFIEIVNIYKKSQSKYNALAFQIFMTI